jgi:hypothetical protein
MVKTFELLYEVDVVASSVLYSLGKSRFRCQRTRGHVVHWLCGPHSDQLVTFDLQAGAVPRRRK